MRPMFLISISVIISAFGVYFYTQHTKKVVRASPDTLVARLGVGTLYPINTLTPGDIATHDTSVVCQPFYYRSVKDVPGEIKKLVYN